MKKFSFDRDHFYIDGKPLRVIAGDIHYFRIHPEDWKERLALARDFGLNTVQTYVPWNVCEPKPGEYCFDGMLDLGAYLRLCGEMGMYVLLRPSPYICSEWDFGGLPAWLLRDRNMTLRSSDPAFLAAVRRYYSRLIPEFLPYLATNGGPVLAVALENEYGSYGNDHAYMNALAEMLREGGVDVPLYTTDGECDSMLTFGKSDAGAFFGVNYRAAPGNSASAERAARKYGAEQPFFIGEFWSGRSMHWGEPFRHRPPEDTAEAYREALELGGHVCFYMFSGGSNFGFMGGANIGHSYSPRPDTPVRYIPHTTSYDVDALIGENGEPTRKYFLCRDVLDEYLGREKRPHTLCRRKTQSIRVQLSCAAGLFDNLDALTGEKLYSAAPKPMEDCGQSYGLILYTTGIDAYGQSPYSLQPYKYKDRVSLYAEGLWFASYLRDRDCVKRAEGEAAARVQAVFAPDEHKKRIDILAENIGRINYGRQLPDERKGLEDCILCGGAKVFGYETRTLPLGDLSGLVWKENTSAEHMPYFYKGTFDALAGADTFITFASFGHGYIWVNGFNVGRYDSAGPQMTLYLPGHFLREKDNEIIVLDIDSVGRHEEILLLDHEILEGDAEELR
ncbi:MAG: beta-galactosidase [Clostridia bacterium]|nr:beta-galactosidase [Clostridia bacterium]